MAVAPNKIEMTLIGKVMTFIADGETEEQAKNRMAGCLLDAALESTSRKKYLCPNCGRENAVCSEKGSGDASKFWCPDCTQEWFGNSGL